mmetsp:Transcript_7125/g.19090  ORF Transcript_7125/g.19090 Transcript_7125/m.19090 type:complete len:157 (+) Transcript_7125:1083-1553(+)
MSPDRISLGVYRARTICVSWARMRQSDKGNGGVRSGACDSCDFGGRRMDAVQSGGSGQETWMRGEELAHAARRGAETQTGESRRELCVFCRIVKRMDHALVVHETRHTLALLDARPVTRGHTLVIPKAHRDNILEVRIAHGPVDSTASKRGARLEF